MRDGINPHLEKNRHHFYDEDYNDYKKDLTFIDYIENLCDWVAAMSRNPEIKADTIRSNVKNAMNNYNYSEEIQFLMLNTLEVLLKGKE